MPHSYPLLLPDHPHIHIFFYLDQCYFTHFKHLIAPVRTEMMNVEPGHVPWRSVRRMDPGEGTSNEPLQVSPGRFWCPCFSVDVGGVKPNKSWQAAFVSADQVVLTSFVQGQGFLFVLDPLSDSGFLDFVDIFAWVSKRWRVKQNHWTKQSLVIFSGGPQNDFMSPKSIPTISSLL